MEHPVAQPDGNYLVVNKNGKTEGPYTMEGLQELMLAGQIGPRSLIRNLETGEDAYLDQIARFNPFAVPAPTDSNNIKASTARTITIIAVAASVLIIGMVITTSIANQQRQKEMRAFRLELAQKLHDSAPKIRAAISGHNHYFPNFDATGTIAGIDPLGTPAMTTPRTNQPVDLQWNNELSGKKLDFTKNAKTWVLSTSPYNSTGKELFMTLDGAVYEVNTTDYYEVAYSSRAGMIDTSKFKLILPP